MRFFRVEMGHVLAAILLVVACDSRSSDSPDGAAAVANDAPGDIATDGGNDTHSADASLDGADEPRRDATPAGDDGTSDARESEIGADRASTGDVSEDEAETTESDGQPSDVRPESFDVFTDPQDIADAACPTVIRWGGNPPAPTLTCNGATCPGGTVCIPGCAIRERTDAFPCDESICKPDELCSYEHPGVEAGVITGRCVPGPRRTCAPGQDCCFPLCQIGFSVIIDLEARTQQCYGI
jgi:hypothetical protein